MSDMPARSALPLMSVLVFVVHLVQLARTYLLLLFRRGGRAPAHRQAPPQLLAFFHPAIDGGGGGEKVFYAALAHALGSSSVKSNANSGVVVFASTKRSDFTANDIKLSCENTFGITWPENAPPVTLVNANQTCRTWTLPETYPVATMIGQALGFARLVDELVLSTRKRCAVTTTGGSSGALRAWDDARYARTLVDTAGNAFACARARTLLQGCRVVTYTHYPLVNSDMEAAVRDGDTSAVHNRQGAGKGSWRTRLKLLYYGALARTYGAALRRTAAGGGSVLCNSTWTLGHVRSLMGGSVEPAVVFPPRSLEQLLAIPIERKKAPLTFLCVGQYRPEKQQRLLLDAWRDAGLSDARLVFAGGARGEEDLQRAEELRAAAMDDPAIEVLVNVSHAELLRLLASAHVGLHAMRMEHFGICVVEYMAAGCVAIAHDSGGPREDILAPRGVGYLASDRASYSAAIAEAAAMSTRERHAMVSRAREHVRSRFGDAHFRLLWERHVV